MAYNRYNPCQPCCAGGDCLFMFVFIDESSPYGSLEYWNADKSYLDAAMIRYRDCVCDDLFGGKGGLTIKIALGVPTYPCSSVRPFGVGFPSYVQCATIGRPPSTGQLIALQQATIGYNQPDVALILVDNSGSMTRGSVAAGLDPYEVYLQSGGTTVAEQQFYSEQWLRSAADFLTAYIESHRDRFPNCPFD